MATPRTSRRQGRNQLVAFFFYKLAGSLAAPPGLIVVILLLLAHQAFRRPRKTLLGTELFLVALCLYLLSAPASSRRFVGPLENITPSLPEGDRQAAVVVLAAGIRESDDGRRELKPHSLQRLVGGWELARERDWPLIVAEAMAEQLARWGFEGKILLENRSRTTWENLAQTAPLLKAEGITDIVIVTHAYHMKRALLCAEKALPESTLHPWPVGYLADRVRPSAPDWLPDAGALFQSMIALRERLGLFVYRFYL